MSKTKICTKCEEELPATKEYFYKNKGGKYGLDSKCKECKSKQTIKAAQKRMAEGRHLIHDLVCDWCNKEFKGRTKTQRFCSTDCQYEWQKNSDEYKEIHKNNGLKPGQYNQYGSPKQKEEKFKKQFENLHSNFKYHSGYVGANDNFKSECRICGYVQERNAQIGRLSRKGIEIQCDNCNEINRLRKDLINILDKIYKEQERAMKKKVEPEIESLQRIKRNHNHYLECKECGREYFNSFEKITCSIKCSNKRTNRIKEIRRRTRTKENGNIDWDISIERLCKRDKDICYLCNEKVDKKDYMIRKDGTFIAGDNYPSVDHVTPISKGGTHTWDNVRLAHRHCNTVKSDNDIDYIIKFNIN